MSGLNPNPVRKPNTAANIEDATAAGRDMLTAANKAAQRNLLELGTAALSDDADFATAAQGSLADSATQPGDLATVATSGAYADLSGTPTLGTAASTDAADYATAAQGALADSATQPGDLGALALLNEVTDTELNSTKLNGIEASADVTDAGNVGSSIHGATAKTTPVDADTVALIDSAESNVLKKLSWANIKATLKTYFDTLYRPKTEVVYYQVALSPNGSAITAGTGKGFIPITVAGTITAVTLDIDAANEATDQSTIVDLNKVNRTTGVATTVLSALPTIAVGANTADGTVDGTQAVVVGDWLQADVDQGSDGQDAILTVEVTPS